MKTATVALGLILSSLLLQADDATTNRVLRFSSPADYIEIADTPSLTLTNNLTFEAWINPSFITVLEQTIISKTRHPNGTGFELRTQGSGISIGFNNIPLGLMTPE